VPDSLCNGHDYQSRPIPPGTPLVARNYNASKRPFYQVIGDPADPNPGLREGFDGSGWEYYGDPGIVIRTVGAAAAATRHTAEFLRDSLVDYQEKETQLRLQDTERIGDRNCYRIFVTLSDGFEKYLFVDQETFLTIASRLSAPIHAFGQAVTTESRFFDYEPVNGSPHTPAPRAKTPLQDILEKLYAERTDSIAVMYSYRLFRRTHPDVDTREGIEFVGYQMAKTKDFAASVELLRPNAADYPASASAQFGVGRALQAAGDNDGAAQDFRKALELDPQFKKATDGLNALR
jgi:tetratricopeptide (TPR) repeat protein